MYYSLLRKHLSTTKPVRLAALICAVALTSACGGSGGGSGGGDDSPASVNQRTLTISATENSVETRQLDAGIDADSITPVSGFDVPAITTDTDQDTLIITIGDLANEESERLTLKTDAGTQYTIVVDAENLSAATVVSEAKTLTEISSAEALADEDLRLLNTVLEIEYLAGRISESEKASTSQTAATALNSYSSALSNELTLLSQALTDYKAGDVTETDLRQQLGATSGVLTDVGNAGETALENITDTLYAMGITLPSDLQGTSPLEYVAEADRFSRFMDSDYGSFDGSGNFSFNNSYDFFNVVFHYASQ